MQWDSAEKVAHAIVLPFFDTVFSRVRWGPMAAHRWDLDRREAGSEGMKRVCVEIPCFRKDFACLSMLERNLAMFAFRGRLAGLSASSSRGTRSVAHRLRDVASCGRDSLSDILRKAVSLKSLCIFLGK